MKDILEEKIAEYLAEGRFVKAKLLKSRIENNRLDYNFNIIDQQNDNIIDQQNDNILIRNILGSDSDSEEDYTYIN